MSTSPIEMLCHKKGVSMTFHKKLGFVLSMVVVTTLFLSASGVQAEEKKSKETRNQVLSLGYELSSFGRASGYMFQFFPENFNLGLQYTYFGPASVYQDSQSSNKFQINSNSIHLAYRFSEENNTMTYISYGVGKSGDIGVNKNPSWIELLIPFSTFSTIESNYSEIMIGAAGTQPKSFNWLISLGYRWGTKNDIAIESVSGIAFGLSLFYNL
jgi:hypothetical protein